MPNPQPPVEIASVRWRGDVLLLMAFFGALYFFALGRLELVRPDEPRYAEIAREMIVTGDWVTPRLNDTRYFEKPPLVYWTAALSQLAFGPGEAALRLTPTLFALGGILLTYAAARRLYGREAGLAAAIVLGTSILYFGIARLLQLDMALSTLMSAALFSFILGLRAESLAKRRWFFRALYAAVAFATLTKGLIGVLIPGAVMFVWLLVFNQWHRLRPLHLPEGIVIFLLVAGPWHILIAQRNPEWAHFYFVHEHWTRFTTTTHDRTEPFWYFIPVILVGLFPWTGFLFGAVREAAAGGWSRRKENADAWFFITWAAFIFLFFSKSQSKLIPYMLPVFPPLAVLIGVWLARRWAEHAASRLRLGFSVFAFACGLIGAALLAVVLKPGIIRDPEQMVTLRPFAFALAATLFLGGVSAHWAGKVRGVTAGLGTMVGTMIGFFLIVVVAGPKWGRGGTKEIALVARERVAAGDRVFHYWAFFHDFVYYSGRTVGVVSNIDELEVQFLAPTERAARFIDDLELKKQWTGSGRIWLVARKRDLTHEKSVFADPAFRYHLIAENRTHSLFSNRP
jgi:4-amino-4-deoxy-L-arabinose transferase-like glycosyltransferase